MKKSNMQGTEGKEETLDRTLKPEQIEELAKEAYIYGLQQAVTYETRYVYSQLEQSPVYEGTNRLNWFRKPITAAYKEVVTPNATTLYGGGFLDLSKEPVIVELPAIKDRYYSCQVMDQYGDFYFYAGNQFTGTDTQKYILVGPGWEGKIPNEFRGVEIIDAPSSLGFTIIRIALESYADDEVRIIKQYQDQITTTPLSEWLANDGKGVPYAKRSKVKGDYPTFPRIAKLTRALVEHQTAMDYFQLLSLVLNDPTMTKRSDSCKEIETLERLAKIGLAEGVTFDPAKLSEEQKTALEKGFAAGKDKVKQATRESLIPMNGWMLTRDMGNYGTDYLTRAVIADAGWAGPEAKSHTGAFCFVDSNGKELKGQYKYTLTFDTKNLPPVTEFWSIPIYDIAGYFVDNEIDRYTVNSFGYERGEYYVDPDGKLTFYIRKEKPGDPNKLRNWLPAPEGDFRFAARFYGPHANLIDGSYDMPRVVKVK